jgi:hypothetical protein
LENLHLHRSRKVLRKIFLWLLAAFLFLIISAVAISFIYSKEIKAYVITSINKNLNAEIKAGDINFSVLNKFPFASIEFTDVTAKESRNANPADTLFTAKEFSMLFNIMDVIGKKYNLKKIVLEDASINLKINKDGSRNFEIWKTDSSRGGDFSFEMKKVEMKSVMVSYLNIPSGEDFSFYVKNGSLSGNFSSENYLLTTSSEVVVQKLISNNVNYISNKEAKLDLTLLVDKKTDTYTIEKSSAELEGINIAVNGTINTPEGKTIYDLGFEAKKADFRSLLSLLPAPFTGKTDEYNFKGKAYIHATIKGTADKKQNPVFALRFGTTGTDISRKNTGSLLQDVKLDGFYTSQHSEKNPVSYLYLKNISAVLHGHSLKGSVEIENLKNPWLHIEADASADLAELSKFIDPGIIEKISGEISVKDANFTGRASVIASYVSSGNIRLNNASFKFKQKPVIFSNVAGDLTLNKNNLRINSLSGKTPASDFSFSGDLNNLFGYFFTKNEKLNAEATLHSGNLDLNEIMEKDASTSVSDTVYKIRFADNLGFLIHLDVGHTHFNKFSATDIRGTVQLENSVMTTHSLLFNAMDGSVSLQGSIREIPQDSLVIQYTASIKNLDIQQLFFQMGNFGQQTITNKNLKGNVTADVQFSSRWSNTLQCNYDKVIVSSALTIENGELLNFTPMLALSKYVKGADLNDIKFSTLKNTVEIKERKITIPAMEINSSAMNIVASGTHGFDNMIDYHLQLLLSQVIGKKVKNMNTEFGTIEDDNLGRTRLFISMKGPASNPKLAYDSKSVKEKIAVDFSKEKQNLKEILKKEFGSNKENNVQAKKEDKNKKQEELQIETEEQQE